MLSFAKDEDVIVSLSEKGLVKTKPRRRNTTPWYSVSRVQYPAGTVPRHTVVLGYVEEEPAPAPPWMSSPCYPAPLGDPRPHFQGLPPDR